MHLEHVFAQHFENFLNAISLRLCSGCSKTYADAYYCDFCFERLKFSWLKEGRSRKYLDFDFLELTEILDLDLPLYPRIYAATKYDDATKAMIRHFKYRKPFLSEFWAAFLYEYWSLHADWILSDLLFADLPEYKARELMQVNLDIYICPVPMYTGKEKKRKYNQAKLLAADFASIFDLSNRHPAKRSFASDVDTKKIGTLQSMCSANEDNWNFRRKSNKYLMQTSTGLAFAKIDSVNFLPDLISRVKDTPSLFNKAKTERLEIIKAAFVFNMDLIPKTVNEQLILVLDDISTSGATFLEIFKTINKAQYQGELVFLSLCG